MQGAYIVTSEKWRPGTIMNLSLAYKKQPAEELGQKQPSPQSRHWRSIQGPIPWTGWRER